MFICAAASAIGFASSFAHMSMNARAIPNSSLNARPLPFAWRVTKSASTFDERSATSPRILATSAGSAACSTSLVVIVLLRSPHPVSCGLAPDEPDDTVGAGRAPQHTIVHQVVQVGDRLAHREEGLVIVELAPEQRADDVG